MNCVKYLFPIVVLPFVSCSGITQGEGEAQSVDNPSPSNTGGEGGSSSASSSTGGTSSEPGSSTSENMTAGAGTGGSLTPDTSGSTPTTNSDAGRADSGASDASTTDAGSETVSIEATPGEWTWVPVGGSRCLDGSSTGFAINFVSSTAPLAIHLDAGGACVDPLTCSPSGITKQFGAGEFAVRKTGLDQSGIFVRDDANNPLANMNWVFVPYCTGDLHSGTVTSTDGLNFQGWNNVDLLLNVLAANYPSVGAVLLTGASAGGFGTFFNFEHTLAAFPNVPLNVLNDSGPILGLTWMTAAFQDFTFSEWQSAIPQSCNIASGAIFDMYDCLSNLSSASRFGVVTSTRDSVNPQFLRDNLLSPAVTPDEYAVGIAALIQQIATRPQWALFVQESTRHIFGDSPLSDTVLPAPNNTTLSDFIAGVITGGDFGSAIDPSIPEGN